MAFDQVTLERIGGVEKLEAIIEAVAFFAGEAPQQSVRVKEVERELKILRQVLNTALDLLEDIGVVTQDSGAIITGINFPWAEGQEARTAQLMQLLAQNGLVQAPEQTEFFADDALPPVSDTATVEHVPLNAEMYASENTQPIASQDEYIDSDTSTVASNEPTFAEPEAATWQSDDITAAHKTVETDNFSPSNEYEDEPAAQTVVDEPIVQQPSTTYIDTPPDDYNQQNEVVPSNESQETGFTDNEPTVPSRPPMPNRGGYGRDGGDRRSAVIRPTKQAKSTEELLREAELTEGQSSSDNVPIPPPRPTSNPVTPPNNADASSSAAPTSSGRQPNRGGGMPQRPMPKRPVANAPENPPPAPPEEPEKPANNRQPWGNQSRTTRLPGATKSPANTPARPSAGRPQPPSQPSNSGGGNVPAWQRRRQEGTSSYKSPTNAGAGSNELSDLLLNLLQKSGGGSLADTHLSLDQLRLLVQEINERIAKLEEIDDPSMRVALQELLSHILSQPPQEGTNPDDAQ